MFVFLSLLAAVVAFFIVILLLIAFKNSRSLDLYYRLRRYNITPFEQRVSKTDDLTVKAYQFLKKISKPLVDANFAQSMEYRMRRAGLPLLGGEFIVLNLLTMILAAVLTWFITLNYILAVEVVALVPVVYWVIIIVLSKKRLGAFTEQLGTSLITIANALRAGYSFQQTIEVIAAEMEPPIGEEFSEMYHQIVMGMPLEEVLEDANKRIGSSDFELAITAVLIQREVGGNLAQILDNISDTIMERIRMRREIESVTAQGRMSAIVLLGLPFAAGFGMFTLAHDSFMMLFQEDIGRMAMLAAVFFEIVGYFVIMKIVDIEV